MITETRFDGGYFDRAGKAHYYITDRLGNNCGVAEADGKLVQTTFYYPYGEPWEYPEGQQFLYSDKELMRTHGLHQYEMGARRFSPAFPSFTTPDSHAESYHHLSPYSVCGSNPIANIDPTGNDVVVLHAGIHLAMLAQNEDLKWAYYSFNGDKIYEYTDGNVGGNDHANLGEITFDSPEDFFNSDFNRKLRDGEDAEIVTSDQIANFKYTEGLRIPATKEQDAAAAKAFVSTVDNGYNLLLNNCTNAVRNALVSAGLYSYYTKEDVAFQLIQPPLLSIVELIRASLPSTIFNSIQRQNPQSNYLNHTH